LFGIAIRTKNHLNISLPSLFWKLLTFEESTIEDLEAVDRSLYKTLDILSNLEHHGITGEQLEFIFPDERFVTLDSRGKKVELVRGGRDIQLNY